MNNSTANKLNSAHTVIKQLMHLREISESDLARGTGIAQSTLNRILSKGADPRASTLKPIANFFKVSVSQLIGEIPVDFADFEFSGKIRKNTGWRNIPVIDYQDICFWQFVKQGIDPYSQKFIVSEKSVSENCFAFKIGKQFEPMLQDGSIIIVDQDKELAENSLVLLYILNQEPIIFRVVNIENGKPKLKEPLGSSQEIFGVPENARVIGVIIESRINQL